MARLTVQSAETAFRRSAWHCHCGQVARDWHHVFPQSKWPELGDISENVIAICRDCHERHHNASKRLPRSVCKTAEGLPMTPAMESYLDRIYGPKNA